MFNDEAEARDRVFITLLVVAVLGALIGIRLYASHLKAEKAKQAALIAAAAAAPTRINEPSSQSPPRVLHLEALTHVYECERDGQRVLTDRPCGTGVPIRIINEPNRMQPQDTSRLLERGSSQRRSSSSSELSQH
jgi:hypothetical protein